MTEDLVIIGNGAAAFAALIRANELGVRPVMIGQGSLGGTCVNVGCVPSKRLLRLAYLRSLGRQVDLKEAVKDKDEIVSTLRKEKYEDVLNSYDVKYVEGKAHFVSPNAVKVNGEVIEGKKFVIATGSSPHVPEVKGLREAGFWTNVEALSPPREVSSLTIIGGRAQALEFAQMYKGLGVDVVVLQRSRVILPDWEPEVSLAVQEYLEKVDEIPIFTSVKVLEVKAKGEGKVVVTDKGEVEADEVLVATGRKPNTDLNLEAAGVMLNERGGVMVDEELRTTNPNVFAAGDVIGDQMLEALAGKEGAVATENALTDAHKKIDRLSVPQAVFIEPNAARVGLTLLEASKSYKADARVVRMGNVSKARILREDFGLIKTVIDAETKRVLGVQMFGKYAAEVINEAALAIKLRATIDDVVDTVHVFPTMAEAFKLSAMAFKRDVQKMSCCVD